LSIRGYEIPNPHWDVLVLHGGLTCLPAIALLWAGHALAGLAWLIGSAAFFHLRNWAVRREIALGWHDPIWGTIIQARNQQAIEAGLPRWMVKLGRSMYGKPK
jgi:hypothetical protein